MSPDLFDQIQRVEDRLSTLQRDMDRMRSVVSNAPLKRDVVDLGKSVERIGLKQMETAGALEEIKDAITLLSTRLAILIGAFFIGTAAINEGRGIQAIVNFLTSAG